MQPITALVFTGGLFFNSFNLDKPDKHDLFNKADLANRNKKTCTFKKQKCPPAVGSRQADIKGCLKAVYYSDVDPDVDLDK